MHIKLKRLLAAVLTVCLTLSFMPVKASAAVNELSQIGNYARLDKNGTIISTGSNVPNTVTSEDCKVSVAKKIKPVAGQENVFDITLEVATSEKELFIPTGVDVVLVFDVSSSMDDMLEGVRPSDNKGIEPTDGSLWNLEGTRWSRLRVEATAFIEKLLAINPDNRASIVIYSGHTNGDQSLGITDESPIYKEIMSWADSARWGDSYTRISGAGSATLTGDQYRALGETARADYISTIAYDIYYRHAVVNPNYTEYAGSGATSLRGAHFSEPINKRSQYGYHSGTNIQAGFVGAQEALRTRGTTSNLPFVVFMADGEVNRHFYSTDMTTYQEVYASTPRPLKGTIRIVSGTVSKDAAVKQSQLMKTEFAKDGITLFTLGLGVGDDGYGALTKDDNPNVDKYFPAKTASRDNNQLLEAFESIGRLITEAAKAWQVTDPMGRYIEFLGYIDRDDSTKLVPEMVHNSKVVASTSDDTINWIVRDDRFHKSGTTYTYSLSYRVRLTNEANGFESNADTGNGYYLTNGVTSLTYYLTGDMRVHTIDFNVPTVKAFVGCLSFNKVDEKTHKISGITFTLTHADDCGCGTKLTDLQPITAVSDINGIVKFDRIPSGHRYILTETGYDTDIYQENISQYAVTVSYGKTDAPDIPKHDGKARITNTRLQPEVKIVKTGSRDLIAVVGNGSLVKTDSQVAYTVTAINAGFTILSSVRIYDAYLAYMPVDVKVDGVAAAVLADDTGSYVIVPGTMAVGGTAVLTYTIDLDNIIADGGAQAGPVTDGDSYTNTAVVYAKWPGQKENESDLWARDTHTVVAVGEAEIHSSKLVGDFTGVNTDGIPTGIDFEKEKRLSRVEGHGSASQVPGGSDYNAALEAWKDAAEALDGFKSGFLTQTGKSYQEYADLLAALLNAKLDAEAEWNASAIKAEFEALEGAVSLAQAVLIGAEANLEAAEKALENAHGTQPRAQEPEESDQAYADYLESFRTEQAGLIQTLTIARNARQSEAVSAGWALEDAQAELMRFETGNPQLAIYRQAIELAAQSYNKALAGFVYGDPAEAADAVYGRLAAEVNEKARILDSLPKPDWSMVANSEFVMLYAMTVYNDGYSSREVTIEDTFRFEGEDKGFLTDFVAVTIDSTADNVAGLAASLAEKDFDLSSINYTKQTSFSKIDLAPGMLLVIFAVADHFSAQDGTFVNTLKVTAEDGYTGAEIVDKETEVHINTTPQAKLSVEKLVSKTAEDGSWKKHISILRGDMAYFRVVVTNSSSIATRFKLSDLLEGNGITLYSGNVAVDPMVSIDIDAGETLTFTAAVKDELKAGYNLNMARITTDDSNTSITKPTDYAAVTVVEPEPDATLVKTAEDSVYTGETVNYQLVVYITGNEAVNDIQVTDSMMDGGADLRVKYQPYGGAPADRAYNLAGNTLTVAGSFNPGDRIFITYTITAPNQTGTIVNKAKLVTGEIIHEVTATTKVLKPTVSVSKQVQFGALDHGTDPGTGWLDSISRRVAAGAGADVTYKLTLTFDNPMGGEFTVRLADALNGTAIDLEGTRWYLSGALHGIYDGGLTISQSGKYVAYIHQNHSRGGYVNTVRIIEADNITVDIPEDSADVTITNPGTVEETVYRYRVVHEYYFDDGKTLTPVGSTGPAAYTTYASAISSDSIARVNVYNGDTYSFTGITPRGTVDVTGNDVTFVLTYVITTEDVDDDIPTGELPSDPTEVPEAPTPPVEIPEEKPEDEVIVIDDALTDLPGTGVLTLPVDPEWTLGALAILASLGVMVMLGHRKYERD